MNRHVEVVRLEVVGHLSEALQAVLPHSLLEAKCLPRLTAFLCRSMNNSLELLLLKPRPLE